MTGHTVITREPEWDDAELAKMLELRMYEAGVCRGCGFHHSLTDDVENNTFDIEHQVCPVCAETERAARIQSDEDRRERERQGLDAKPAEKWPEDGRSTVVRLGG